jgi:hypothetical protein
MTVSMINIIEEDMNKCLNKLQENSKTELNEIKEIMHDIKEEFLKIEKLKKNQIEILEK